MLAPAAESRAAMTLEDRYRVEQGWVYMTGIQALVRLPIQQRMRDAAAGRNTGGYISGYRGSPLGRYDLELWAADEILKKNNVFFRSGLNEDLAATAIWGSQYVGAFPGAKVDGVFGIWYGKGPGVDRSGDALRHANLAGTSALGGVIALAGDDHGVKSSTVANFSDPLMIAVGMPVLYPSNTQELLDFGLHGIALSRYSGCWVGMKVVTDVVEGGGSVYVSPDAPSIVNPDGFVVPPGGLHIRSVDSGVPQEERLYHHKLYAALAYARTNGLNVITANPASARIGIVSAGKAWQDTLQAVSALGLSDVRLLKVGMTWPLDPEIVKEFSQGLSTIVVVEEKRPVLEDQIRAILYGTQPAPAIVGKFAGGYTFDLQPGAIAFPNAGETNPAMIAQVLSKVLGREGPALVDAPALSPAEGPIRMPGFCSGCPHNRSTKVPEGSRALAGIGCHGMALFTNPLQTMTISHMGAEGVMWLGQHPFTDEKHVFANLGDGTYTHSGFLAIRQAVAAHVPITYKLLYNGFVSMTGGQPVEGGLSPAAILQTLAAEGVRKLALVSDDPARHQSAELPPGTRLLDRTQMEAVQTEFREYPDVSVILYEQACATERRRLRKRGKLQDPPKRTFIHSGVCEGCGDCGKVSNCMSIEPLETEFGRKRKINQASCNKDFSCLEGFCPSFVTIHGGTLRKPAAGRNEHRHAPEVALPEPQIRPVEGVFSVLICGIGGTGVVTIGQTLAVAAHLEGLFSSNLDVTGLSQKYGAVHSHVRFASQSRSLHATRISAAEADTLIACDLVVAAGTETISRLQTGKTRAIVCTDVVPTSEFARNPDWQLDGNALTERLRSVLGDKGLFLAAQQLAPALLGDALAANMLMLGAAWQRGSIPLSLASIRRAIELNGVAVEMNRQAFDWGRRAAHDLESVERFAREEGGKVIEFTPRFSRTLDEIVARRVAHLTDYQDAAFAKRYTMLVQRVRSAEADAGLGDSIAKAVARSYFKLLADKDEWEVARLFSRPEFIQEIERTFEGKYSLHFHVGAWPFARKDATTGKPIKTEVGPWLINVFKVMARFRRLRGTWLDPFRFGSERRLAAQLRGQYEGDIDALLKGLNSRTHEAAVRLAALPEKIRGFGHVREASAANAAKERQELLAQLESPALYGSVTSLSAGGG